MPDTTTRARRPKDRRRTIELAATDLFASHGYAGTGLADIATKVGITPAAIYRHFAGKDEILETIVLDSVTDMAETAEKALTPASGDPEARLGRVLGAMIDSGRRSPQAVTVYIQERHRLGAAANERRHASEQRVSDCVSGLVHELRPDTSGPELVVRLRAMNGVLASAATQRHSIPAPRLRSLFVDGLQAVLLAPPDPRLDDRDRTERTWTPPRTRRAEVLDAAARLFRMHGYHGAGIDQIGEAAGIAGPTVYGTYPGKADILVDAVDYAVATLEVLTNRALAHATSPDEAIRLLADSYAETILTNLDIVAVAARDLAYLPEGDRARIRRRQEDYRQRAQGVLLELRPELSEAEARSIFTGAYALVGQVALGRRPPSRAATAALMVTFLLADAGSPS